MRSAAGLVTALSVLALLAACAPSARKTATPSAPKTMATIQDIMISEVDPAADALWAVGSVMTRAGTEELGPRTQVDWDRLRGQAVTLIEAPNLLVMPGRAVSGAGKLVDEGKFGIQSAEQIRAKIASDPAAFAKFAHDLQLPALDALQAIKAKDKAALMDAGEKIDTACEQCHLAYWYPKPKSRSGAAP